VIIKNKKPTLSIIIVNFNVKELLLNCLESIYKSKGAKKQWEIIVVDNASSDNSVNTVKKKYPLVRVIVSKRNLGFSSANNLGVSQSRGKFVLFLNPDTLVESKTLQETLDFMIADEKIGALTCRVDLPDGKMDYSCHRGFPTPWNSLCYFTGLSKLFPKSKTFAGYPATYHEIEKVHVIDCCSGVFLLVRREAGDNIGWWDEDYFWNGEDIEFCYRLKEAGYLIYFYPKVKITHFKGSSSGLKKTARTKVLREVRIKSAKSASEAMKIFYKKHYQNKFFLLRILILFGIFALEKYRLFRISLSK